MATTYNASVYQGAKEDLVVTVSEDGSAKDFTGYTTTDLTYKVGVKGNEDQITYDLDDNIALTTPASGVITITLAASDTGGLTPGRYTHELWIDDGTDQTVIFQGTLTILDSLHVEE